jgi:hypothetical protein
MRVSDGSLRALGADYLDEGWLDHAYALTAHAAQGATVDRSFVLGSDELSREWGYTALSRHQTQARFYLVSPGTVERALPGLEPERDAVGEDVVAMLSPSHRKELALDVADRARASAGQRARQQAHREIEAAQQRIEAMRAEQAELGRLQRSRRATIDNEITRQEEAIARWSEQAATFAPSADRVREQSVRNASEPDRAQTRVALLERDPELTRSLGEFPSGFTARERWLREAATAVQDLEIAARPVEPAVHDLGMDM